MARVCIVLALALLLPGSAFARDQLRIVGSSTVFPFIAAAAEQFGHAGKFRTPIVEATGTGGGLKLFCEGAGDDTADMANASRRIKEAEIAQCVKNNVGAITELEIGYDGIVLANARGSAPLALTRRVLFLALARDIPRDGKLIANPYTRWQEIDPTLPDVAIEVYGPPPSSGTRDAFSELVMGEGCKLVPEMAAAVPNEETRKHQCMTLREDGKFVEAGEDDNLIVQKLINNPEALGIFGYSFLEGNAATVKANAIDGVMPSYASIESANYHVARSLYVYVKNAHLGRINGLAEFAREFTADTAMGPDGYMVLKGLLPLRAKDAEAVRKKAAGLMPAPESR